MRDTARQYLLDYLQDEFRHYPLVRIRIAPFTREEDDGVTVKTESREYFFPTDWIEDQKMQSVEKEVLRIKEVLDKEDLASEGLGNEGLS